MNTAQKPRMTQQQVKNERKRRNYAWRNGLLSKANQIGIAETIRRGKLTRKERIHEDVANGLRPEYPWYQPSARGYRPQTRRTRKK